MRRPHLLFALVAITAPLATASAQNCLLGGDSFEPNNDCPGAVMLPVGTTPELTVEVTDSDFFSFRVGPNATFEADALFETAVADVDIYLWDPAVSCDSSIFGQGFVGQALAVGFSASDNESISWTNVTGGPVDVILEVRIWSGSLGSADCNDYDLTVANDAPLIGTPFCTPEPNSLGQLGRISARGSEQVADDFLELAVSGLPPWEFGLFLVAQASGTTPVGDGTLCLSGSIGRYIGPTETFRADGNGDARMLVELGMIPSGNQFLAASPGATLYFQAWHRDRNPFGPSSNFTDAVQIDFQ